MKIDKPIDTATAWRLLAQDPHEKRTISALASLCDDAQQPRSEGQSCYEEAVALRNWQSFIGKALRACLLGTIFAGMFFITSGFFVYSVVVSQTQASVSVPVFLAVFCAGTGVACAIYVTRIFRTETCLKNKLHSETACFFEKAVELYNTLFYCIHSSSTDDNFSWPEDLRHRIESITKHLAEVIKNQSPAFIPDDLIDVRCAEERKLLKAAVDLVVHLRLMGVDDINDMPHTSEEALQKYRKKVLYQILFEGCKTT